jgi:hypothetical protein
VTGPREPGERPSGDRRLERAPGERYERATAESTPPEAQAGSTTRGIAWAVGVGIAGAAIVGLLGGPLSVSFGLLVGAAAIGRFVGLALVAGGARAGRTASATSAAIAVASVLVGQLLIWLFARSEGGVLGLLDYEGQTFGALVPLEVVIAAAVASWSARPGDASGTGG